MQDSKTKKETFDNVVRMAYECPELRPVLLPLLKEAAAKSMEEEFELAKGDVEAEMKHMARMLDRYDRKAKGKGVDWGYVGTLNAVTALLKQVNAMLR